MLNPTVRMNSLQTYQLLLYNKALHPELFQLRDRRVVTGAGFELEAWIMPGRHLLRFALNSAACVCELVTDREEEIPEAGVVAGFFCAGERDFDRDFALHGINYMTTVQTEQLNDNIFLSTLDEMREFAASAEALSHAWSDETGPCLSVLDLQRYAREIHAQSYHLISNGRIVLRTQTIFERHGR